MKNNILFYQHFCDSDQNPKFKMLRLKYGWEGEGKFWGLNNRIAQADNCRIDISKKYNFSSIACDLNFSLEEFNEFIEYLHKDCNLILRENEFITTKILQENLKTVMKKRSKNQKDYIQRQSDIFSDSQLSENEIQTSENIQSKLNKSKLNKSKVKESKENNIDSILNQFKIIWNKELENYKESYGNLDFDLQEKLIVDWIKNNYLKANKKRDLNLFICNWLSKAPLKKNSHYNFSNKNTYMRLPTEDQTIDLDRRELTEKEIKQYEETELLRLKENEERLEQNKIKEKQERKKKKISDLEFLLESEKKNIDDCKKNPETIPDFVLKESKKEVERIEVEIKRVEMKVV